MSRSFLSKSTAAYCLLGMLSAGALAADEPINLVDPFVGTSVGNGAMYPGAALPFGMVKLSPDTTKPSSGGYNPAEPIIGFSHTHIGGTGGSTFDGQVRVRPETGPLVISPPASPKANEAASPGYYAVDLSADNVHVELTAAERAGFHRYSFPAAAPARILIDLTAIIDNDNSPGKPAGVCMGSSAKFTTDHSIEGSTKIHAGVARLEYSVYFIADFDRPAIARGTWLNATARPGTIDVTGGDGQQAGLYAEFAPGSIVNLRVGISFTSINQARENLKACGSLNFDQIHARARQLWSRHFSKINVEGGNDAQRKQFYTAMYHCVLAPTDVTGDNGGWASDPKQPVYYDIHTLWDTFRTADPLRILICPDRERGIIQSLLAVYESRGWLPDAWAYNHISIGMQGGTDADNVIADAVVKKLGGFSLKLAWDAIYKDATATKPGYVEKTFPDAGRFPPYLQSGYVPGSAYLGSEADGHNEWSSAVSRTLEYSYNDFCISEVAAALGRTQDAKTLREHSLNAYKLFRPDWKMFWGKTADGRWVPDVDPKKVTFGWDNIFYEGSGWHYRFDMPHDMAGLIKRMGGDAAFIEVLDTYFDEGLHYQGNEPGFLNPWLYIYAGRPDKAADRVHKILADSYHLSPDGYAGDEDVGAMSSWYVLAAVGLFPNAGQDIYLLTTPLFQRTTIKLGESGRALVITAPDLSPTKRYVQSATLNGKPLDRAWLRHAEIIGGADLVLMMGDKPSAWGATQPPPSVSTDLGAAQ